jgi:hypothetical protein
LFALAQQAPNAVRWLAQTDKPLAIDAIDIQPLEIEQLSTGENQ